MHVYRRVAAVSSHDADANGGWPPPRSAGGGVTVNAVSAVQAGPTATRAAIAAAAATGPFFQLAIVDASTPGQWRLRRRGPLRSLAAAYAARLGTREPRVSASILHLDVGRRLWSPVSACGLLHGVVPDLSGLLVTAGSPIRFGIRNPAGGRHRRRRTWPSSARRRSEVSCGASPRRCRPG